MSSQAQTLEWIAAAHTRAEGARRIEQAESFDEGKFRDRIARELSRFGCGEDKIAKRGHQIADCVHTRWSEMEIYRFDETPSGALTGARTAVFEREVDRVVGAMYGERCEPPADLIHVTCTGYASPSAAQRLVSRRGWGRSTRVTHAYHMGCYAAFPALRMATGFLASAGRAPRSSRADVVHTEICSLHMNPLLHTPEQLVVQSLFADGFIRYSVEQGDCHQRPCLTLLALDEVLVPDSTDSMRWFLSNHGMQMALSRDVPERIAGGISTFVRDLLVAAGLPRERRAGALYAVHPGGPRILDGVRDALEIEEASIRFSRAVLRERGNMSSATLPHVWMKILDAPDVAPGTPIVSLAFGPGLTVCGAVMVKAAP